MQRVLIVGAIVAVLFAGFMIGARSLVNDIRADIRALKPEAPRVILKAWSDKRDDPVYPEFFENSAFLSFWAYYEEQYPALAKKWTFGEYRDNLIQIINLSDRVLVNLVVEVRMLEPRTTMQFASVAMDSKYRWTYGPFVNRSPYLTARDQKCLP